MGHGGFRVLGRDWVRFSGPLSAFDDSHWSMLVLRALWSNAGCCDVEPTKDM